MTGKQSFRNGYANSAIHALLEYEYFVNDSNIIIHDNNLEHIIITIYRLPITRLQNASKTITSGQPKNNNIVI